MLIDEYFVRLHHKLERIEQDWVNKDDAEKLELAHGLLELRQASDQVVDLWLQFEERLSRFIKQVKAPYVGVPQEEDTGLEEIKALLYGEEKTDVPKKTASAQPPAVFSPEQWELPAEQEPFPLLFRKGEGFYHLRLFQDAKHHFADLVKQYPDFESGRLYLAYSLLFCGETEAAMREFRLLSRSASSPQITAISYNALGCQLVQEEQWLEAAQAFNAALEIQPTHQEARFNLALCYLLDEEPQAAIETLEKYLEQVPDDWEAQLIWIRAARLWRQQDEQSVVELPQGLGLPKRELATETLRELATTYEQTGQIHRAHLCYRYLVERLPTEAWTWHGLAWNVWLINGLEAALPLIKKAITLSPDNPDFQFTYGWMYLFADGGEKKAEQVFQQILASDEKHYLALSGMIILYGRQGKITSAQQLADTFIHQQDPYIRSLGFYHHGRLAVLQERWQTAMQYFDQVSSTNLLPEVQIYRALCHNRLGRNHWQANEMVLPH